jgi:hypothetical protein
VLRRLVEHIGLEDASEVVALATTEQLERVLDEDLWKSASVGADEEFDPDRFALWLEVLLLAGEDVAVSKLRALDEDLLTLGLSRNVLVLDIDAMAQRMSAGREADDDLLEKALESALGIELEEFRVIARDPMTFDTIVTVLVALDRDDHALLRRVLERCCAIATEWVEENGGLYDVLTGDEMLESDVAGEREARREEEGFVAPADARAFLRLAGETPLASLLGERKQDPVTRAHFRAAPPDRAPKPAAPRSPKVEAFLRELGRAGVLPRQARVPLLEGTTGDRSRFEREMGELKDKDPAAFGRRLAELAYLVNLLIAGASFEGRVFRPVEAAEVVNALANLGLERMADADLTQDDVLIKAFRVGWNVAACDTWDQASLDDVRRGARSKKVRSMKKVIRPGR